MKVLLLFCTLLAFGAANEEECGDEAVEACVNDLLQLAFDNSAQIDCKALRDSEKCLIDLAEKCLDEEERAHAQPHIDEMTSNIDKACGRRGDDDDDDTDLESLTDEEKEMVRCVQDEERILAFVGSCAEKTFQELTSGAVPFSGSMSDMNCIAFLSIARCVTKEVGNLCGEPVEKPFFQGMLSALEQEDPRAARSPQCAAAIREVEENEDNEVKRKRRHLSNINFSKFLP